MKVTETKRTAVFYTVVTHEGELHFFTAWQTISYLAKIDLTVQLN